MHSFLIASKDRSKTLEFAQTSCKEKKIDQIDLNLCSFEKAVGIEDVRDLQKRLFLKPIKSSTKASIIDAPLGITTEAQNALLKILEEPPKDTIIMLLLPQKEMVLPTILSRCKIIDLKENLNLTQSESAQYLSILVSLTQKGIGERLKLAQDIAKDKGNVQIWLEKMILIARHELIKHEGKNENNPALISQYLNILVSLTKTYKIISTTNANQRLALENLFLNLRK